MLVVAQVQSITVVRPVLGVQAAAAMEVVRLLAAVTEELIQAVAVAVHMHKLVQVALGLLLFAILAQYELLAALLHLAAGIPSTHLIHQAHSQHDG